MFGEWHYKYSLEDRFYVDKKQVGLSDRAWITINVTAADSVVLQALSNYLRVTCCKDLEIL